MKWFENFFGVGKLHPILVLLAVAFLVGAMMHLGARAVAWVMPAPAVKMLVCLSDLTDCKTMGQLRRESLEKAGADAARALGEPVPNGDAP